MCVALVFYCCLPSSHSPFLSHIHHCCQIYLVYNLQLHPSILPIPSLKSSPFVITLHFVTVLDFSSSHAFFRPISCFANSLHLLDHLNIYMNIKLHTSLDNSAICIRFPTPAFCLFFTWLALSPQLLFSEPSLVCH